MRSKLNGDVFCDVQDTEENDCNEQDLDCAGFDKFVYF